MMARIKGAELRLFVGDEGGGGFVLVRTATLATPWNDTDHRYVGLVYTHHDQGLAFVKYGSSQVALVPSPAAPGVAAARSPWGSTVKVRTSGTVDVQPNGFPVLDLTTDITYLDGAGWLSAVPDVSSAPTGVIFECDPTSLAVGTYQAVVSIDSPDIDTAPAEITVEFVIFLLGAIDAEAQQSEAALTGYPQVDGSVAAEGQQASASAEGTLMAGYLDAAASQATAALTGEHYYYGGPIVADAQQAICAASGWCPIWVDDAATPGTDWEDHVPVPGTVWEVA